MQINNVHLLTAFLKQLSRPFAAFTMVLAIPSIVAAGIFDDTDKLKGKYIIDVGDLEQMGCPISGQYDCTTWPSSFYRFKLDRCYEVIGLHSMFSKKALLAVDDSKRLSLFVITDGFNRDIKQHSIISYKCPSSY